MVLDSLVHIDKAVAVPPLPCGLDPHLVPYFVHLRFLVGFFMQNWATCKKLLASARFFLRAYGIHL